MNGVTYVVKSGNTKIMGSKPVDATYASIKKTCPSSCSLSNGNGCYAELSFVGMIVSRLNKEAVDSSALDVARAEAKAIDMSYNGGSVPESRAMRLHVAGDSKTVAGSKLINSAVGRWKKHDGGDCWSYTHAWKTVHRSSWHHVSMLASVSNVSEVKAARLQGYAPAIVVDHHDSPKAFTIDGSDVKWIPCPAQTKEVGCSDCRLCFNANRLYEDGFGIAFAAHGVKQNHVKKHLNVLK